MPNPTAWPSTKAGRAALWRRFKIALINSNGTITGWCFDQKVSRQWLHESFHSAEGPSPLLREAIFSTIDKHL